MITISRRYAVSFLALGKRSLPMAILVIYIGFVTFALFNYRMHCIFTEPSTLIKYHLLEKEEADKLCRIQLDSLGVEDVDIFHDHDLNSIQHQNPLVLKGGEGKPEGCVSYQKVAIIVPYRNRYFHLKLLLSRLHPLLRKQKIHYRIFVIEQATDDSFNRGKLMNVGFKEALKEDQYDCFVFHDVDMIPENNKNLYLCDDHARHLSSAIDEMRYHVMYYNYAGGVIAMKKDVFKVINGYANSYWGWGNEDDDLSARIQEAGYLLTRPPEHIGRYKMVRHKKESRSENGYERFLGWRGRWLQDGLHSPKTMTYKVLSKSMEPLYTNITVNLLYDKNKEINVAEDTTKESLWWFLKFYFP